MRMRMIVDLVLERLLQEAVGEGRTPKPKMKMKMRLMGPSHCSFDKSDAYASNHSKYI